MLKIIASIFISFSLIFLVTACSTKERVGRAANKVVTVYCKKPQGKREIVRTWIDTQTSPHQIRVICAGDVNEPDPNSEVNQLF